MALMLPALLPVVAAVVVLLPRAYALESDLPLIGLPALNLGMAPYLEAPTLGCGSRPSFRGESGLRLTVAARRLRLLGDPDGVDDNISAAAPVRVLPCLAMLDELSDETRNNCALLIDLESLERSKDAALLAASLDVATGVWAPISGAPLLVDLAISEL